MQSPAGPPAVLVLQAAVVDGAGECGNPPALPECLSRRWPAPAGDGLPGRRRRNRGCGWVRRTVGSSCDALWRRSRRTPAALSTSPNAAARSRAAWVRHRARVDALPTPGRRRGLLADRPLRRVAATASLSPTTTVRGALHASAIVPVGGLQQLGADGSLSGRQPGGDRMSVGGSKQPVQPAGDGVFGHRRVDESAELFQRGLRMLQPQPPRPKQMLWGVTRQQRHRRCTRATAAAAA